MQQEPSLSSIADHLYDFLASLAVLPKRRNAGDSDVYYSAVTATE